MFTQELQKVQQALNLLVAAGVSVRCVMILISGRSDDQPISRIFQRCKRILLVGILILTLPDMVRIVKTYFLIQNPAGIPIESTTVFTGGLQLLKTVLNMAIGVDAVCTAVSVSKELFAAMSGPAEERTVHYQACKKYLVIGIAILLVFGVVDTVLTHYFL